MERKLAGRTAIVTGAARGLGRGVALRLAALGADVAVNDINLHAHTEFNEELSAPTVSEECEALGVRSLGIEADMTSREAVQGMVDRVISEWGGVDILVNVAGGMLRPIPNSYASTMDPDDYEFIMAINATSAIYACQAVIPSMKQRGGGRIVNTSSTAAFGGGPSFTNYGIAKAAVIRYTRSLAAEVGEYGIHVNCIAPALIATSRANAQFPERAEAAQSIPLRRLGEPEDVAKVVEFLVTDLSDYITGQVISVCGGRYLNGT